MARGRCSVRRAADGAPRRSPRSRSAAPLTPWRAERGRLAPGYAGRPRGARAHPLTAPLEAVAGSGHASPWWAPRSSGAMLDLRSPPRAAGDRLSVFQLYTAYAGLYRSAESAARCTSPSRAALSGFPHQLTPDSPEARRRLAPATLTGAGRRRGSRACAALRRRTMSAQRPARESHWRWSRIRLMTDVAVAPVHRAAAWASWRTSVPSLVVLALALFVVYAFVGPWLPGFLAHGGESFLTLVDQQTTHHAGDFAPPRWWSRHSSSCSSCWQCEMSHGGLLALLHRTGPGCRRRNARPGGREGGRHLERAFSRHGQRSAAPNSPQRRVDAKHGALVTGSPALSAHGTVTAVSAPGLRGCSEACASSERAGQLLNPGCRMWEVGRRRPLCSIIGREQGRWQGLPWYLPDRWRVAWVRLLSGRLSPRTLHRGSALE